MSIVIRPASRDDEAFLREMLYESLFIGEGETPLARDVVERPEIAKYVAWGRDCPTDTLPSLDTQLSARHRTAA